VKGPIQGSNLIRSNLISLGSTETAEYFFQTGGEPDATEQQREHYFRVQPVVEKKTEQAAENDRAYDGERQLHC
jgi:hypothetical protein